MTSDDVIARARVAALSARQREVMTMISDGHGVEVIANRLGLTEATARHYVVLCRTKLKARTIAQAAATFVRGGGIEGDSDEQARIGSRSDR